MQFVHSKYVREKVKYIPKLCSKRFSVVRYLYYVECTHILVPKYNHISYKKSPKYTQKSIDWKVFNEVKDDSG